MRPHPTPAASVRTFRSPRIYMQGPGVLDRAAEIVASLGAKPSLITDAEVARLLGTRLAAALAPIAPEIVPLTLEGEITRAAVERLAAAARGADVVVAAGGGRALDAGKAVARRLGVPLVLVATIASSDAAPSRSAVLHEEDGEAVVEQLDWSPDAVIADTAIIAAAPARFLRCGIADALATSFELEACAAVGGDTPNGGPATIAAAALAGACHDTIRRHSREALEAVAAGVPNAALEAVVEAALLLSGLGVEGGGLSIAHSVAIALAATPGLDGAAHGEQVAYGLLVQLALGDADELSEMSAFYEQIGLPRTLAAAGAPDTGAADIEALARTAAALPWAANHPLAPAAGDLVAAIERVEASGRAPGAA